jgi:hypothetical protein
LQNAGSIVREVFRERVWVDFD